MNSGHAVALEKDDTYEDRGLLSAMEQYEAPTMSMKKAIVFESRSLDGA